MCTLLTITIIIIILLIIIITSNDDLLQVLSVLMAHANGDEGRHWRKSSGSDQPGSGESCSCDSPRSGQAVGR